MHTITTQTKHTTKNTIPKHTTLTTQHIYTTHTTILHQKRHQKTPKTDHQKTSPLEVTLKTKGYKINNTTITDTLKTRPTHTPPTN
jgi:hypothetical protein